jgi:hypothetical protein
MRRFGFERSRSKTLLAWLKWECEGESDERTARMAGHGYRGDIAKSLGRKVLPEIAGVTGNWWPQ